MIRSTAIVALIAFAGSAAAQFTPGSLLYVSDDRNGGSDTINGLDYNSLSTTQLFAFAPGTQDQARHGGLAAGPNGEWYVANSPTPISEPSEGQIFRVDGLFSGAPSASLFSDNDAIQNTAGMRYDPFTDSLLTLNNPGSNPVVTGAFEGLQSHDRSTGSYDGLVVPQDATTDPAPRVQAVGGGIVPTGRAAGQYYFGSLNGGADTDPGQGSQGRADASVIYRMQLNDPANPLDDTSVPLIDLSPTVTGNSEFISLLRGMDVLPNGNIIFSDVNSQSIWEVAIDGNGDFAGLNRILDLEADGRAPGSVIYNPFTNKINYVEFTDGDSTNMEIVEINLDGTGANVLASGLTSVGALVAIPAPASAALLGLGGLAAARRRR